MSAGIYNRTVEAERDLVFTITWLQANEIDPVPLDDYTRFIYNIQSTELPTVEVLTADSDINSAWIQKLNPPGSDGKLKIAIPGSEVPYVPSKSSEWEHELVILDGSGGRISIFRGKVKLKPPIALWT